MNNVINILTETIEALTEAAATVQKIKDLIAEGNTVEAGKLAYDFEGERYNPYHSCYRFPAAPGFRNALDTVGCAWEDHCNQNGMKPETGKPYDG